MNKVRDHPGVFFYNEQGAWSLQCLSQLGKLLKQECSNIIEPSYILKKLTEENLGYGTDHEREHAADAIRVKKMQ